MRMSEKKVKKPSHSTNSPSIMEAPKVKPLRMTLEMLSVRIPWLSDRDLDQLFAKICLEKLKREAKAMITIYGGK